MIAIFIPCIFKLNGFERGNDKKLGKKKKLLFYLILMAIFCFYSFVKGIPTQMKMESITDDIRLSDPLSEGPFIHISIDMILFTITTILFLKYRYYRHNFISMLFFVILGSCCDIILNYYSPMIQYGFTINFLDFLSLVTDIICFCFQKYLMEFLYFPYWNICFANGLALFILSNGLLITALLDNDKIASSNATTVDFYYFLSLDNREVIIGKLILMMVVYFFNGLLSVLNVYYFNPNFILIGYYLSKIFQVYIDEGNEKYYCTIIFALQLFFLMIYLEIIELNFCDLNKNTKRNIEKRGIRELQSNLQVNSEKRLETIDINDDYYIQNFDNDDSFIKMNPSTETESPKS